MLASAEPSVPTTPMRVLLVIASMGAGGAERVLTVLAAGLAERGHEVSVLAPPGIRDAELAGVPHLRLPLGAHGRGAGDLASATIELARCLRRLRPDLIHAQNVRLAALAGLAARLVPGERPPVLATFHGVLPAEYGRSAKLLRLADHIVCVSQDLADVLLAAGFPAARASVVRNAVSRPSR